ncbi:MAG: efflux RND transporter periplasmic adaptor subunit [Rhodopirellula bahusiensis]|uniref:efflux RND transporter periplasmic adaptor subunit n=1 Tax=Rhodopirellula bahusiensis TaxID=2014065 RepID=UPI003297EE90
MEPDASLVGRVTMQRDPGTIDWQQQPIRIASDVKVWPVRETGEPIYRIEIPATHQFFRVGLPEYTFLSALDGHRTIAQACGLVTARMGRAAPSSSQCESIARWLIDHQLAHFADAPSPRRERSDEASPTDAKQPKSIWSRWNPFWIKMPIPGASSLLQQLSRGLGFVFSTPMLFMGVLIIAAALFGLSSRWSEFLAGASSIFDPSNWAWLLFTAIGLKLVHELGHAIACHRSGGSVREAGLVWVLMTPLAYVDVSSCWRLPSRWSRIGVAAAGMFVEGLVASLAIAGWLLCEDEMFRWWCHHVILTAGLSTILFNANVLMRFDGYFMLSDLIDVPNLATEANQSVRQLTRRWFLGDASWTSSHTGWRRSAVFVYGVAAFAWRVLVCVSLAIAASTMFGGAGVVLSILGIWMWWGKPFVTWLDSMLSLWDTQPLQVCRGAVLGAIAMAMFGWMLVAMPVPSSVRVPVVVQYDPDSVIRAGAEGFLTELLVNEGDEVQAGDLLAKIENRELRQRIAELEIAQKQNDIRLRKAIESREESERLILLDNRQAVLEKLTTLRKQSDQLHVLASRTGRVIADDLRSKLNTYIGEGDVLMIVAAETDKEVLAVINQAQVDDVRRQIGQPVRLVAPGRQTFWAELDQLQPRASDRVPNASLAATHGGPLAVRVEDASNDESSNDDRLGETTIDTMRLLQPHFRGVLKLPEDEARRLPAGLRLEAHFGWHQAPIAKRLNVWFQNAMAEASQATR